jgi:hypothetical protein
MYLLDIQHAEEIVRGLYITALSKTGPFSEVQIKSQLPQGSEQVCLDLF